MKCTSDTLRELIELHGVHRVIDLLACAIEDFGEQVDSERTGKALRTLSKRVHKLPIAKCVIDHHNQSARREAVRA